MNTFSALSFRAGMTALLVMATTALPAAAGPKIHSDMPLYDFGSVNMATESDKVSHTFQLTNSGDALLEIEKVKTSCGCTTAKLKTQTLAPGESVSLETELSLKGRRGLTQKSITVYSNDPDTPQYRLTLKVDIIRTVELTPYFVNLRFEPESEGPPPSTDIGIRFNTETTHRITSIETNSVPYCNFLLTGPKDDGSYSLNVTLIPEAAKSQQRRHAKLKINTDHPDIPSVELPVSYYSAITHDPAPVMVFPPSIRLPESMTADNPFKQTLLVRSTNNKPLEVQDIKVPEGGVTVTTQAVTKVYARYLVEFASEAEVLNDRKLSLTTLQDGRQHTLEVPLVTSEGE